MTENAMLMLFYLRLMSKFDHKFAYYHHIFYDNEIITIKYCDLIINL